MIGPEVTKNFTNNDRIVLRERSRVIVDDSEI